MSDNSAKHSAVAMQRLEQVDTQVAMLASAENGLERGYAHLGYLLLEVSEMQYWRVQFDTFRAYLQDVATESGRSPARIMQYFLAVRDLSDVFSNIQLEAMGITKALELRKAKDYAIVLPPDVVKAALDPAVTVRELKVLIRKTILRLPEEEPVDWMDLDFSFSVTPEERATIEDAIRAAEHCDPVTKKTIAESAQKKDVVLKWAMEFLGGHPSE